MGGDVTSLLAVAHITISTVRIVRAGKGAVRLTTVIADVIAVVALLARIEDPVLASGRNTATGITDPVHATIAHVGERHPRLAGMGHLITNFFAIAEFGVVTLATILTGIHTVGIAAISNHVIPIVAHLGDLTGGVYHSITAEAGDAVAGDTDKRPAHPFDTTGGAVLDILTRATHAEHTRFRPITGIAIIAVRIGAALGHRRGIFAASEPEEQKPRQRKYKS